MAHCVLFVDDEPNVTRALKRALHRESYEILEADSAREALEILKRRSVDLVVSDEQMPGMSGSEFLAVVNTTYPDTMRIILTGQANLEAAIRAINEGEIYRFLTKPCNGPELAATIRQALEHKDLMEESRMLLRLARHQSSLLEQVEEKHPGITDLNRDPDGRIVIEEADCDFDTLIDEINAQVKRSEKFFTDRGVASPHCRP